MIHLNKYCQRYKEMDYKETIINELTTLAQKEKSEGNTFKFRAYQKVIKNIKDLTQPIHTMKELEMVEGIGDKIKQKLAEIFEKGYLLKAVELRSVSNPKLLFQDIYGIGPRKSEELVTKHHIKTIEELRKHPDLLNSKQLIGLKYYEPLQLRIPREEMENHEEVLLKALKKCCPAAKGVLVGSYRRKMPNSGDIDMLVTNASVSIVVKELEESKYILETLAKGDKKFMGICSLKNGTPRRLDILCTPQDEYPFAVLYFTGSDRFNIQMRTLALQKGLSLNEHGFTPIVPDIKTEEDIFHVLNMAYVEPYNRI